MSTPIDPRRGRSRLSSIRREGPADGGAPLPRAALEALGNLLGADFETVRVFEGAAALGLGAAAFARGERLFFAPGLYRPWDRAGWGLLAHELGHVLQQRQGRTPAAGPGRFPIVVDDPRLEAEAELGRRRAQAMFDPELASRLRKAPRPRQGHDLPEFRSLVDGAIQRGILQAPVKREIEKAIVLLVNQMTPSEFNASSLNDYAMKLFEYIQQKDYIFSGEKIRNFSTVDATIPAIPRMAVKDTKGEALGDKFGSAKVGDRIALGRLHKDDWRWVKGTVRGTSKKLRFPHNDYIAVTTKLLSEADHQWVAWETSDCVFSAILNALGLNFKGKAGAVIKLEQELEGALAERLSIPKKVVEDVVMIYLIEGRLAWPRVAGAKTVGEIAQATKDKQGKQFLMTYCENESKDFWHTILVERKREGWDVTDRQYERAYDRTRGDDLTKRPYTEATAWEIKADGVLMKELGQALNIEALKTKHRDMLKT